MFVDTHCHLLKSEYDNIDEILDSLKDNVIIVSGDNDKTNKEVIEIIKNKNVYGVIGIHPNEIEDMNDKSLEFIEANLSNDKIVGIGEIGLDYHYGKEYENMQKEYFIKQLDLARKYKKPVVIHSRDAAFDTFEIIKKYTDLKITYHCYSYSLEMAKELEKLDVKFGIGGVVTFKNSKEIKKVVESLSLESLLLETDSPYLSPEPFRGKKNDPTKVIYVAQEIAKIKNIPLNIVLETTAKNAIRQFDLPSLL